MQSINLLIGSSRIMSLYTCEQPLAPHVGACPPAKLRFTWPATTSGAPDMSSRIRGLDDRSFIRVGELVRLLEPPHILPHAKNTLYFR